MYISAQTSYDRSTVKVWERTKEGRITKEYPSPFYFFVEHEHGEYRDYKNTPLKKLEFNSFEEYYNTVKRLKQNGISLWESDIPLEYKVLSQYYYNQDLSEKLNIGFYDIEIDYDKSRGMPDIYNNPYAPINAISLYTTHNDKTIVFAVPPKNSNFWYDDIDKDLEEEADIRLFKSEKDLLLSFIDEIYDVDILSGWNSESFDDIYVYNRLKMVCGEKIANKLSFDDARKPYFKEVFDEKKRQNKNVLIASGRVLLDLMRIMMKFEPGERDSFALEAIADEKLSNLEKLSYEGTLADLYVNDFNYFLRYNIRDCVILKALEEKYGYIKLCILLSHMDTGLIEDVTGTIKLTEMAIINYCHHRLNIRVKDKNIETNFSNEKFGGAIVLPPQPGLHKWIATIDVNSLYPSTMRTVNISFDTIIGQFTGNHSDFEKIKNDSEDKLTLVFEDGNVEIMTAKDWKELLLQMGWCISGFGTVFTMEKIGIIPSLLTEWFAKRKEYKKKSEYYLNRYDESKKNSDYDSHRLYDLMQSVFKLKLNSTYGACGNKFFRFYDVRMAESTTKTGREVLFHMTKTISKCIDGKYEYPNNYVLGGDTDSVSGDSIVQLGGINDTIENHFNRLIEVNPIFKENSKEIIILIHELNSPCFIDDKNLVENKQVLTIYRHLCDKQMYKIELEDGSFVEVTEDHSLMVERNGNLMEVTPTELESTDICVNIDCNRLMIINTIKLDRREQKFVYDIVMKDNRYPYFFANNILVHNSCFFKTLQNNYEDCSKRAKEIANEINLSFDEFAVNSFLINDNFKGIFAVSQETVSDAAIITGGKKNYIMHAVEKDGKPTDKMIIKGLQIKKTNTPKPIRSMLISHFERLLKGEDWSSIGISLLENRELLLNNSELDVESLGLPIKVNSLENYQQAYYNKTPGKTIPGHVMSAIMWNECLDKYNDKETLKIVSGMKIKKFYFKKPIGDFKAIAIPVDIEALPNWFIDNYAKFIDKEQQVVRIIDQACAPILEAIGAKIPTRKTFLIEELVEF